jgi:hypothetical protein
MSDDVLIRPGDSAGPVGVDEAASAPTPDVQGPWLTAAPKAVLEMLERSRRQDKDRRQARRVITERNVLLREGVAFARIRYTKDKDTDVSRPLKTWVPPGARSGARLPSKADDLCRKLVAQLNVDPPRPDVEPRPGDDREVEAGQFAARWLEVSGGESGRQDGAKLADALDAAMHSASGWLWLRHRMHGQYAPVPMLAFPWAQTVEDALAPNPDASGAEPTVRYVRPDGTLTDATAEAERQWVPTFDLVHIPDACVTMVPVTAPHISEADGAVVAWCSPWSEWQALYPDAVAQLTPEQIQQWAQWTPDDAEALIPAVRGRRQAREEVMVGDQPDPDLLLWGLHGWRKASPAYPKGAYVCATPVFVARGVWEVEIEGPDGLVDVRPMDLPLVQVRPARDTLSGDARGRAMVDIFGPADDVRQAIWGGVLSHLDRILNPMMLLDSMSVGTVEDWTIRDGRPKFVPGLAQGGVQWENVPALSTTVLGVLERVSGEMDTASGLEQTAQGVQAPSVGSGKHAQMVIAQALVALGQASADYLGAHQRLWRLACQYAQKFLTVPQRLVFAAEDGDVRERWFRNVDFSGVRDVTIKRGTGTLMSPEQKQQWVAVAQQQGWLPPEDAQQLIRSNASTQTTWSDTPHRHLILRQVTQWEQGPPDGWSLPAPQVDPQTGQPVPVADPANPFVPRPNDEEPTVAKMRHYELSRVMASAKYARMPQAWRAVLDAEYQRMAYAAGIVTVRQQYEQQQAAQQAQAQQDQQAEAAKQAAAQPPEPPAPAPDPAAALQAQVASAVQVAQAVNSAMQPVAAALVDGQQQTQAAVTEAFAGVSQALAELATVARTPPVIQVAPPDVRVDVPPVQFPPPPTRAIARRRADGALDIIVTPPSGA